MVSITTEVESALIEVLSKTKLLARLLLAVLGPAKTPHYLENCTVKRNTLIKALLYIDILKF